MERCVVVAIGAESRALVAGAGVGPWRVVEELTDEALGARVVVVVSDDADEARDVLGAARDFGRASVLFALRGTGHADLVVGGDGRGLRALLWWAQSCRTACELERGRLVVDARWFVTESDAHRLRHVHVAGNQALLASTRSWLVSLRTHGTVTIQHEDGDGETVTVLLAAPRQSESDVARRFGDRIDRCFAGLAPEHAPRLRDEVEWWQASDDRMSGILGLAEVAAELPARGFLATPYLPTRGGGSLVAHALGLTPFDPIAWQLGFEHFTSVAPLPPFTLGLSIRGYVELGGATAANIRGAEDRWGFGFARELTEIERPWAEWSTDEPDDERLLSPLRSLGRDLECVVPPSQVELERLAAILELGSRSERDEARLAWEGKLPTDRERGVSVPDADARTGGVLVHRDQVAEAVARYLDIPLRAARRIVKAHASTVKWAECLAEIDDLGRRREGMTGLATRFELALGSRCIASHTRAESLGEALIVLTGLRRGMSFADAGLRGQPGR